MDNRVISIKSDNKEDFELAVKLLAKDRLAIGWMAKDGKLIMFCYKHDKMTPLPYEMGIKEITDFAWGWLQKNEPNYTQPDHDGDNEKWFYIYCEDWGHVEKMNEAFMAVEPIWAMYGK